MNPTFSPNQELRYSSEPVTVRDDAVSPEVRKVRGYAAVFNRESINLGTEKKQFIEVIKPGAFDDVMLDDVRALLNHDASYVLARSKNGVGTLALGQDDVGLWYEFDAPKTQAGQDLIESITRGDIDQSSFSFVVKGDGEQWERHNEQDGSTVLKRTISKIARLFDVSPVTYPAYPDASVALRSLSHFEELDSREEPAPNSGPTPQEISELSDWAAMLGLNETSPT